MILTPCGTLHYRGRSVIQKEATERPCMLPNPFYGSIVLKAGTAAGYISQHLFIAIAPTACDSLHGSPIVKVYTQPYVR